MVPGIGNNNQSGNSLASALGGPSSQQLVTEQSFLKLLITELKNQDPTQPADPTQMVAQLASFSSLEQMTQMNTNMKTVLENSAVNMIGQNVTVADQATQSGFTTGKVVGIVYFANTPAVKFDNGQSYALSAIQNVGQ
jgi:flagellar basal-body rod modification protein FlgD